MSISSYNSTTGELTTYAGSPNVDQVLSASSKNPIANKAVYNALAEKIEKTVNDLVNYYTMSQVYNKAEVRELIGAINTLTLEVVGSLPTSDISDTTIYLVGPTSGNYDEYIHVGNTWVKIGDTQIDLSNYVTSEALTTALQSYYTKTAVDALLDSYYTKSEVDTELNTKQDSLTFDNEPTNGSANPVKSGGVYSALAEKQDTLTFDNTPTENSANVVKSGGVYSAVDDVYKVMGENGSKNLLKYPYNQTTKTISGITFTDNGDGSITANGTATASVYLVMSLATSKDLFIKSGKYTISGCPSGGSSGTYRISCGYRSGDIYRAYGNDVGNGFTFTATSDDYSDEGVYLQCACNVDNGTTVNNIVFKPMLRLAEDTDSTYQPYTKTNQQLTVDKVEQIEVNDIVNVYGAKNLIPYPYYQTTQTYSGITTTDNGDGTLTFDGTSTAASVIFRLTNNNSSTIKIPLNASNYVLTWVDSDQHSPYFRVDIGLMKSDGTKEVKNGESGITYINNTAGTYTGVFAISVYTFANQTVSDLTFYPMLRLANVKDSTWTPYTMTNKQLTQKIVNTYQFVEDTVISTTSGSYATCMTDVVDLLTAYQATCDSNEFFKIQNVNCGGLQMSQQIPFDIWPTTDFSSSTFVFSSTVIHSGDLQIFALRDNVTDGLHRYTLDNTTLNWSHYVFNSTNEITIAIRVYKYRKV